MLSIVGQQELACLLLWWLRSTGGFFPLLFLWQGVQRSGGSSQTPGRHAQADAQARASRKLQIMQAMRCCLQGALQAGGVHL